MDVIALPLQGGCIFFPVPRATASPLPWADMLRPFRPSKMYKLQSPDIYKHQGRFINRPPAIMPDLSRYIFDFIVRSAANRAYYGFFRP